MEKRTRFAYKYNDTYNDDTFVMTFSSETREYEGFSVPSLVSRIRTSAKCQLVWSLAYSTHTDKQRETQTSLRKSQRIFQPMAQIRIV